MSEQIYRLLVLALLVLLGRSTDFPESSLVEDVAAHHARHLIHAPVHLSGLRKAMLANHVWMSQPEQLLILSYLNPQTTMLEYGSGLSTLWYSRFVRHYYSIEHNAAWYNQIKANITSVPTVGAYLLKAVEKFDGDGGLPEFKDYIQAVDELGVREFDAALVDGRARVDCAKYILKYLHPRSIVFVHDFWRRSYYHTTLQYYDVVASINEGQSLVVLRPKLEAFNETRRRL